MSDDWTKLATQLGVTGALVAANIALLWYLVTKALPDMVAKFTQELNSLRADDQTVLQDKRNEFIKALGEQRQDFKDMLQNQQTFFLSTLDRIEKRGDQRDTIIVGELKTVAARLETLERNMPSKGNP